MYGIISNSMRNLDLETKNLINLFSETPEMFCLLEGPLHKFIFVNTAHIKVLGFDATGKEVRQAQPESVEVHGILDQVYQTGQTAHLHRIAVTVGKNLRYFNLTYAARKNEQDKICGIMILGSEITESVLAEMKVKESEEKLKLALESGRMGLWHFDLGTNIVTTSETLNRILGVDGIADDIEKFHSLIIHPEDKPGVDAAWKKALEEKKIYSKDYRIIKPSGEIRWITSIGSGKYDSKGTPLTFAGISIDITDSKLTEQKLKEALQFRDEFLSVASHELKTPLTSLKLQVQTAARKLSKPEIPFGKTEMETLLMKNDAQVDRLTRLVDDMLDLSRIQSGRLSFVFRENDLCHLLSECQELFREQFEHLGSKLTLELRVPHATGYFDRERLEQVITNLLTNAIKYGKNKPVTMTLERKDRTAVIRVSDNGTGIAKENLEKVFRKFERAVSPSEVSGLGIGLYISREIIEAHGGKIWVESQWGTGSSFFVELPLTK